MLAQAPIPTRLRHLLAANLRTLLERAADPIRMRALLQDEARLATEEAQIRLSEAESALAACRAEREALHDQTQRWLARAREALDEGDDVAAEEAMDGKPELDERDAELGERERSLSQQADALRGAIARLEASLSAALSGRSKADRVERAVSRADERLDRFEAQIERMEGGAQGESDEK